MRNLVTTGMSVVLLAASISLGGCSSDGDARANLESGYQALESKNYDTAMSAADQQLSKAPGGPGSAEALYLRGRALEQRQASSPQQSRADWQAARAAYQEALAQKPSPQLEAHIRAGLANVAYFQDDYATAIQQWSAVNPRDLKNPDVTSWILYRTGIAQQRIGQFEAADKTFASVQQQFPGTEPARRAKEHQGVRAFYVQLGAYTNATSASSAASDVRRQGVNPVTIKDPQGRQLLRVGPVPSYAQAVSLKSRFTSKYPDAIVVP